MLFSFANQVLAQLVLLRSWQETAAYKYVVYLLPKQLDEKVTICTFLHSFGVPGDFQQFLLFST